MTTRDTARKLLDDLPESFWDNTYVWTSKGAVGGRLDVAERLRIVCKVLDMLNGEQR